MSDLYIIPTNDKADLQYRGQDARLTSGIEVAVYLSLFNLQSYADMLDETPQYQSRIPEIVATSNVTNETRRRLIDEAKRALAWLIDTGVAGTVDVDAVIASARRVDLTITIAQPSGNQAITYSVNWDAQRTQTEEAQ